MNLIEQLGGYRMAKEVMDSIPKDGRSYTITRDDTGIIFNTSELHNALLEHRRQHNIFEIGDKVVLSNMHSFNTIHTVKRVENLTPRIKGSEVTYFLDNSLGCWLFQIRHATDEEIKAGHRL